jgi:hypothetical protein
VISSIYYTKCFRKKMRRYEHTVSIAERKIRESEHKNHSVVLKNKLEFGNRKQRSEMT